MSKKEIIRELEIKNNALQIELNETKEKYVLIMQENVRLRDKHKELIEENTKFRKAMERMSREKVATMSSERTLTEIINIHCENNQEYFKMIMNLLSQRNKMQQQLNEKDYIICQLESALEAAKVI